MTGNKEPATQKSSPVPFGYGFSHSTYDAPAIPEGVKVSTTPFQYGGGRYRPSPGTVIIEVEDD